MLQAFKAPRFTCLLLDKFTRPFSMNNDKFCFSSYINYLFTQHCHWRCILFCYLHRKSIIYISWNMVRKLNEHQYLEQCGKLLMSWNLYHTSWILLSSYTSSSESHFELEQEHRSRNLPAIVKLEQVALTDDFRLLVCNTLDIRENGREGCHSCNQ